jgi:signal transduction histidine kinase
VPGARDITHRRRVRVSRGSSGVAAEAAREKSIQMSEARRPDLARELHDTLGQTLTSLLFALSALDDVNDSVDQKARVREVRSHALTAVRQLRALVELAFGEHARTMSRPHGMGTLLQELRSSGVNVRSTGDLNLRRLPTKVGSCLYGVTREALLNVRRHARARCVEVQIARGEREVELIVADDGKGFVVSEAMGEGWGGFGIPTMRERVEHLGGAFILETRPGQGTRITVRLPCERKISKRHLSIASHPSG